jgi:UDP-N-acetylmuramyl pentapeptide phosphotransferase/UDP-N-acetylglucosamine-1-phosphate transferase
MLSIISLFTAFAISFLVTLTIIKSNPLNKGLWADNDFSQPRKIHTLPVPRIGGMGIFLGLITAVLLQKSISWNVQSQIILLATPIFLVGFFEDIFKNIKPNTRLILIAGAACMQIVISNVYIDRVGISIIDQMLAIYPISLIFSIFAITGLTNAYNIVDGLNGLSSILAILALAVIGLLSYVVDDYLLIYLSLITIGSILGFLFYNFPKGTIFLGDGGAYLIGFLVSSLSILLIARNESISPFIPIIINAYPLTETIFSIYRRKIHHKVKMSIADRGHLHSLIFRRITCMQLTYIPINPNARATIILLIPSMVFCSAGAFFYKSTVILLILYVTYFLIYLYCYRNIIRFRLMPNKLI